MTVLSAEPYEANATGEPDRRLRLLIVMAHGSPGELPEGWLSYRRIEDARASALEALRNPQVLRVGIVEDNPLRLVEWVGSQPQRHEVRPTATSPAS